jgi:hypothetical protein
MPMHEPEVIAAVRRRKPIDSPIMSDDSFPGENASGQSEQRPQERRPHPVYRISRFLVACIWALLYKP